MVGNYDFLMSYLMLAFLEHIRMYQLYLVPMRLISSSQAVQSL